MKCCLSVLALFAFLNVSTLCPAQEAAANADARFQIPASDDGLPGAGPIRRYDWFRKLWAERRVAWAQRVQQDQRAVVFLGDSITQGWGDQHGELVSRHEGRQSGD
jgi:lysophospholipase L1-like esterase